MSNEKTLAKKAKFHWKNYTAAFGLVLLVILSAIMSETFLVANNLANILKSNAPNALLALGMTYVILTGGIDLAVASVLALSGVIVAMTIGTLGLIPSILLALAFGVLNGVAVGLMVTKLRVPPFIATLGAQNVWRGVAYVITKASAQPISNRAFNAIGTDKLPSPVVLALLLVCLAAVAAGIVRERVHRGRKLLSGGMKVLILAFTAWLTLSVNGINLLIVIFVIMFLICWYILEHTVFGRQIYALGGNAEAARLSGIRVDRNIIIVYAISSFLAAMGGILAAARLGSGIPQLSLGGETDAIAAVVLGGTSMSGGAGKITGTILGILLIGVLNNLLTLLGVSSDMQMIFKGAIVLIAVILDTTNHK